MCLDLFMLLSDIFICTSPCIVETCFLVDSSVGLLSMLLSDWPGGGAHKQTWVEEELA